MPADQKSKFFAQMGICIVCTTRNQGSRAGAKFPYSAGLSAEVLRFDIHDHTPRLHIFREAIRNLMAKPLLARKPFGV
jgi:hypothetical protein